MPLISVIMGVYNSDPVKLTAAVNSVLNQSVGDIELIIYNDGSDNVTGKILKGFTDRRVKIICSTENKGLAVALNACIDAAEGKTIQLVSEICRFVSVCAKTHEQVVILILTVLS